MRPKRPRWSSLTVLGDLHLRPGTGLSVEMDPAAFRAVLERLDRCGDALVLNGDVFDLDRGPVPLGHRRAWSEARRLLAAWTQAVSGPWIHTAGNHDALLAEVLGWAAQVRHPVGALRVQVEHGHRFDAPIKQARRFASAVTWVAGQAERPALAPLLASMRWMEQILTGAQREGGGVEERAARWLAEHTELDVLVIGHTHQPTLRRVERPGGDGWLVNPGACLDGVVRWVTIDGREEALRLHEMHGGVESGEERVVREVRIGSPERDR